MSEGIIKSARLVDNSIVDIRVTNGKISELSNKISGEVLYDAQQNLDRKSTRLNSSHSQQSRMPSSA